MVLGYYEYNPYCPISKPYDIKNLMDLPPSYEEATEPPPYHIAILLENPEGALQRP